MTELTDQEVAMVLLLHPIIEGVGSNGYCRWQSDSLCPHYAFTVYAVRQLQPFLAAARAEGARDMRGKIEALADAIPLAETICRRIHTTRWEYAALSRACDECDLAASHARAEFRALLADGGEPQ